MSDNNDGANLAAVVYKNREIRLVQIRVGSVGICGTDIPFWEHGKLGSISVTGPHVPGHESSGVISKVGANVTRLKVGDRVSVEPYKVCRTCDACVEGRYNICETARVLSIPPCDGALTQYIVHDQTMVYKLPDNMSLDEGALCEPLSIALYACRRAKICVGDTVLILGAGPIGLCSLLAAQTNGASATIITDPHASRLKLAKTLGATHTVQISKEDPIEKTAAKIIAAIGRSPNKALECTGAESAVQVSVEVLKPGGTLTLLGFGHVNIDLVKIIFKEIDLIPSCVYTRTWPTAIEMISSGKCNVAPLVTHRFGLKDTQKAFEAVKSRVGMKIMVDCNLE